MYYSPMNDRIKGNILNKYLFICYDELQFFWLSDDAKSYILAQGEHNELIASQQI